jgi:hypothetical protein
METDANTTTETLSRFVQLIGRDPALLQRFCQMAQMSPVRRANAVHILAEQMAAAGKEARLIAAFRLFANEKVFEAAIASLHECGYIQE